MIPKAQLLPAGLVVVFEGIDGVGKSSQLAMARDALLAENWPLYTTRSLGGTPIGEALRDVILSATERPPETNLYISLAIQSALSEVITAQREQGKLILIDRGPLSLAAYEIYGGQLDPTVGWSYVDANMQQLQPDLTLIYQADTGTAIKRAQAQSSKPDYFESQPLSYFERVADGYRAATSRYPDQLVVIDANQPLESVHEQTMAVISRTLDAHTAH